MTDQPRGAAGPTAKFPGQVLASLAVICQLAAASPSIASTDFRDLLPRDALESVWRGYQADSSPGGWRLKDGVLTLDGEGGDLITRSQFGDFDFRFEWKVAPGGNSGVIYRVTEDQERTYMTGPEYQVHDPATGRKERQLHGPAALYGLYRAPRSATKPAGEWNTGRIVMHHGCVEHWINGVRAVQAWVGSPDWQARVDASKFSAWPRFGKNATGHIALQDHDSRVWYRNVRVRSLDEVAPTPKPKRVLFVTQSAGFRHSTVTRKASDLSHSERVMQRLGIESGRLRVDCTQDVETDFTPELLEHYDAVAFYTTGRLPIPPETLDWFLNEWLHRQGHAFLGVHAAADTYKKHEPYWDMLGGTFAGHPWTAETPSVVRVHDKDHPASRPWGTTSSLVPITDEIYQFRNWQPEKVRVLMSLAMDQTERKRPWHVPVLWVKPYGAGRVMHMSLGHREDMWESPAFQQSIIEGIGWLLGETPGDATPNPALSAAEQSRAESEFAASGQELPERERRRLAQRDAEE